MLTIMRTIACVLMAVLTGASGAASQRVRFGPGVCGPIDPTYIEGATETGGQVFPVSKIEVGKSLRMMEGSALRQMILWTSADKESSYAVPIDSTVARVMFSGTFDATGGSLTLFAPDGTVVQQGERIEDTRLNCGRIVTVDAPASGMWQVRVAPSDRFWLTVQAKSDLSLSGAEFVEREGTPESNHLVRIQGEPIAGTPAMLRVSLSPSMENPTFQLVSLDARLLQTIHLAPADDEEFVGTITLPADPFRVLIQGRDESGLPVQRIWPALFHAELIEVVPPNGDTVTAGTETRVIFTIRNHGPAVRLRLVASDHRGKLVAVDPPAVELEAGAEGTAAVRLTVPADAPAASEASIRLTATSDARAAIGGFNSTSKSFTVIRE
jgi:von Willebrand factor A domain-containing protein 7